jgi:menaquinone-dependent protoporphyrinogen IX oxidase
MPTAHARFMAAVPRVTVTYATAAGSTAGIAERIAAVLRADGLDVDCGPAGPAVDLERADAVVVGSVPADTRSSAASSSCAASRCGVACSTG